jgi:hypothetical protein
MRRELAIVGACVTAIWFAALMHWVVTDTVVPWDSKNQFYAFFRFLAASVNAGIPPFWNPYQFMGYPSVADPQSLLTAPAFALWGLIDPAPSIRTLDVLIFAHLLVGGLAVGAIGLRARWPVIACVFAAVLFMLGGPAAGRLQHTGEVLAYGLFPLALLLLQVALQRRSIAYGVAFAVVAAVLALGRVQAPLLFCYVLIAAAVVEIVAADHPYRYFRERLPVFAVMGAVGFVLVIAPLLLTLQFADLSTRADETIARAEMGSFYPVNLAAMLVADVFGSHGGHYWGPGEKTMPELVYTDDSMNYMFAGAAPIVLLMWLGIVGGGAWRRGRIFLSVTIVVAFLYMLGRYTPAFALMFEWVPGVANFHRPVGAGFVVMAMLALLSGHLLSDYLRDGLPRGRYLALAAVSLVLIAIVAWGVMFSFRSGHGGEALIGVLKALPFYLAIVLALAWARTERARVHAAILVTALAVTELFWWNVAFRLNAQPRQDYAPLERPAGEDERALAVLDKAFRERWAQGARPRMEVLGAGGAWQNVPMVYGFEAINGYNPMRIGVYDRLVSPSESNWLVELREFPPTFDGYDSPLARAVGLEFLLLGKPIDQVPNLKKQPDVDVLLDGPTRWIYRLRNPTPRVSFAGGADAGQARIVAWRPDRVEIETESTTGGGLILRDHFYPGWFAEVDGKRVPIRRAETLFRGIDVPAGKHRVVFYYAPFSLENLKSALMQVLGRSG